MTSILYRAYKSTFGVCQRHDLSRWSHFPGTMPKIYGMYHIWCAPGWDRMVSEQMRHLRASGLWEHTEALFISCIVADKCEEEKLRAVIGNGPVKFISITTNSSVYEFPALEYIYNLSQKEDFLFYYFHTKGISYQSLQTTNATFLHFQTKIESWRHMMEYFLMDQWQVAVNVLNDGYDTYGCYLFPPFKNVMYAGNFWWSHSTYFRTLPKLSNQIKKTDRFMAEEWLLSKAGVKPFSAFDTMADLYDVRIDDRQYRQDKHSVCQSLRFFITYTLRKYQKKWFHYSYKHHCQSLFQHLYDSQP